MLALSIAYNKLKDDSLLRYAESVSLTERLGGKASELTVALCDVDGRFSVGAYQATKGDALAVRLGSVEPEQYSIDAVSVQASPRVVTWSCTARPRTTSSPKGRGNGVKPPADGAVVDSKRSWATLQHVTLKAVCLDVCRECGMRLDYRPKSNPALSMVARYNETGFTLVSRLCRRYGFGVRATADRLIVLSATPKGDSSPPAEIKIPKTSIKALQFDTKIKPQKVESARYDPRTQTTIAHSAGDGDGAESAFDFDVDDAGAVFDFTALASKVSGVEVVPDARFVAGAVVVIEKIGTFQIKEMQYSRTGTGESMTLALKAAK